MVEEVEVEREKNMDTPTLTEMSEAQPDTPEPVLADTEAQAVIQAVEPILKKCKKVRPKSVNLSRDQQLNVKLKNGVTSSLNFVIPEKSIKY